MAFFFPFLLSVSFRRLWRFSIALPCILFASSQTPDASLLLLCPRQTPLRTAPAVAVAALLNASGSGSEDAHQSPYQKALST
jgi:hypothetical protein